MNSSSSAADRLRLWRGASSTSEASDASSTGAWFTCVRKNHATNVCRYLPPAGVSVQVACLTYVIGWMINALPSSRQTIQSCDDAFHAFTCRAPRRLDKIRSESDRLSAACQKPKGNLDFSASRLIAPEHSRIIKPQWCVMPYQLYSAGRKSNTLTGRQTPHHTAARGATKQVHWYWTRRYDKVRMDVEYYA